MIVKEIFPGGICIQRSNRGMMLSCRGVLYETIADPVSRIRMAVETDIPIKGGVADGEVGLPTGRDALHTS